MPKLIFPSTVKFPDKFQPILKPGLIYQKESADKLEILLNKNMGRRYLKVS